MAGQCKICNAKNPHYFGTKAYLMWWRQHYKQKHGGFKRRSKSPKLTRIPTLRANYTYCPHCGGRL